MREDLGPLWGVDPVGYRQGNLSAAHAVASSGTALVGGPVLVVGAIGVLAGGVSVAQLLLIAPMAAILGGILVGGSARMAAATGAPPTALLRPIVGSVGSRMASLLRLGAVLCWASVVLLFAGRWAQGGLSQLGVSLPLAVPVIVIALLGMGLTLGGSWSIHNLIRRPLYVASIAVAMLAVFALFRGSTISGGSGDASIWPLLQIAVEICVIFVPFVQVLGRHLDDEAEATGAFGIGYVIPAAVGFVLGGLLGAWAGVWPFELAAIEPATTGALFALIWVVVAEIDQVYAAFTAGGSEASGIAAKAPVWLVAVLLAGASTGLTLVNPTDLVAIAGLATAVVFPIVALSVADFFWVRGRFYSESELYAEAGVRQRGGWLGIVCWMAAVAAGQLVNPSDLLGDPVIGGLAGGPWRLVATAAAVGLYVGVNRLLARRESSTESSLRGLVTVTRSKDLMS